MLSYPQPGTSFGRYDVGQRLGKGAMGVVYAAVHRDLGRDVALKLLSADLADDESYRKRFLREAQTLARLDSPHLVRVHDAGDQDGWLFIVTELVPDGDLQQMLEVRGPLPPALAVDLVRQVGEGIGVAHGAGVLHRDIKPSNVLVRRLPDESLRAIVCDFGIATDSESDATATQGVIGTWGYLAPERLDGQDASVASDVYALGCLLWTLLTGEPPYVGTHGQQAVGHLSRPVRQLEAEHPAAVLNDVLGRAMAKDPADRFSDVQTLAAAAAEMLGSADLGELSTAWHAAPRSPTTDAEAAATLLKADAVPTVEARGPARSATALSSPERDAAGVDERRRYRRLRPIWVLVGVALVLVGGVLVTWASLGGEGDEPRASGGKAAGAVGSPTLPTAVPSEPGATPEPSTPASVLCWDGSRESSTDACPAVRGQAGLRHVYPSYAAAECRRAGDDDLDFVVAFIDCGSTWPGLEDAEVYLTEFEDPGTCFTPPDGVASVRGEWLAADRTTIGSYFIIDAGDGWELNACYLGDVPWMPSIELAVPGATASKDAQLLRDRFEPLLSRLGVPPPAELLSS